MSRGATRNVTNLVENLCAPLGALLPVAAPRGFQTCPWMPDFNCVFAANSKLNHGLYFWTVIAAKRIALLVPRERPCSHASSVPILRESVIAHLYNRVARELANGVLSLRRLVGQGTWYLARRQHRGVNTPGSKRMSHPRHSQGLKCPFGDYASTVRHPRSAARYAQGSSIQSHNTRARSWRPDCTLTYRQKLRMVVMYIAESDHAPSGKLEPLAVLKTNPDGTRIVQTIGPLKMLASENTATPIASSQRFLIVTDLDDPSHIVLRQSRSSSLPK